MLGASLALQNYDTNFETLPKASAQLNTELNSVKNKFDALWSKELGRKILNDQYSAILLHLFGCRSCVTNAYSRISTVNQLNAIIFMT